METEINLLLGRIQGSSVQMKKKNENKTREQNSIPISEMMKEDYGPLNSSVLNHLATLHERVSQLCSESQQLASENAILRDEGTKYRSIARERGHQIQQLEERLSQEQRQLSHAQETHRAERQKFMEKMENYTKRIKILEQQKKQLLSQQQKREGNNLTLNPNNDNNNNSIRSDDSHQSSSSSSWRSWLSGWSNSGGSIADAMANSMTLRENSEPRNNTLSSSSSSTSSRSPEQLSKSKQKRPKTQSSSSASSSSATNSKSNSMGSSSTQT
eukprot:gb/GECH01013457.1/.p1 GENE.gb/GECH01013457.1/~~gb/GECH01013457.1/.p1  ORF type:complete len:271 (+),score=103.59 gb/GECH01013457.1/:1-813(+)